MSETGSSTYLTATADKLAVVETLYRYAAGLDLRDKDLLASAFADDAVADFGPATRKAGQEYPPINGRETIAQALLGSLSHLDTTHSVSNPRVSLDGDTAHLEGIVACQHLPREDHSRHVLMTNRYDVDLARQGDVWVIRHVTVDNAWTQGDPTVLAGI
ncbi:MULTISPECIES: nuclear transport factor 2 family protein [Streptomyces]|uniref:Nuclear transport factor 2 family protein n=1 Tax=Streptomyces glycanivorans TaxID=3033808 RepID=A0ABY9J3K0_9ACTN|nr:MULTISPECIES: nuclear transport factor 2 family protein [unclassified Streptomyces]WSQ75822.1 nuclear transport factor 2 family protein [Streptomyces sp. NBC_01213]TXS12738.1 nuclear transport factor 2 family protein [Streptomyces sp. wa22]WLQ62316.1 nuclear transport factor 2 family protein [Streptomyces sp. Alt3]WSQ83070.1 nuclear transport factor 2 family protein [Streptomyces sp. NBC_01212]WSR10902.1 nuclear transport factor 2 family protein [Streptomyces sp. NBC_01208]